METHRLTQKSIMIGSIHVYEVELAGDEGITHPEREIPIAWERESDKSPRID
jgi:hypothetical protein